MPQSAYLFVVALTLLFLTGCDKGSDRKSDAKSLIEKDPAASFEAFSTKFEAQLESVCGPKNGYTPLPKKLDVKKTDSLVSPVVGDLVLAVQRPEGNGVTVVRTEEFVFHIVNDKWSISSVSSKGTRLDNSGSVIPPTAADPDLPGVDLNVHQELADQPILDQDAAQVAAEFVQNESQP